MTRTPSAIRIVKSHPTAAGALALAVLGAVAVQYFGWRTRVAYGVACTILVVLGVVIDRLPTSGPMSFIAGRRSLLSTAGFALSIATYLGYRTMLLASGRAVTWQLALATLVGGFTAARFGLGIFAAVRQTRRTPPEHDASTLAALPSVTIAVPCFNEGEHIAVTLKSMRLDYPADLYDIVVVDDGSSDDSRDHIAEGLRYLAEHGVRASAIFHETNQGKRAAMANAIRGTDADLVVLVDSDSILEPDALTHLVRYFADPTIGGVSAHADVLNADASVVSRMQVARYFVAFRVIKAGESLFGAVGCLSGCCSAYRREALTDELDGWLNQRFLGLTCTYSDDRALTNVLLRKGYRTVYAPDVRSHTVVPTTFRTFLRQQMRWKRGWVINSIDAARFMWRMHPMAAFMFYANLLLALAATVLVVATVHYGLVTSGVEQLGRMVLALLVSTLLYGAVYSLFRRDHYWLWGIVWSLAYVSVLVFQLPYAILTLRDTRWGTR